MVLPRDGEFEHCCNSAKRRPAYRLRMSEGRTDESTLINQPSQACRRVASDEEWKYYARPSGRWVQQESVVAMLQGAGPRVAGTAIQSDKRGQRMPVLR